MNGKTILASSLLLFVFFNSGCHQEEGAGQPLKDNNSKSIAVTDNPANDTKISEKVSHSVVAYYFHRTYRCPSCLAIEAISLEALQTGFDQELQDGSLEWLTVNLDEPGGEEFVNDFNLVTSSLVIVDMHNEKQVRWKNLENVWELLDNEDAFTNYVQDEVAVYLAGD